MTTSRVVRNDFLLKLLELQQDGKGAISAPTNWTRKPLLEVETEIDKLVRELEESVLLGDNNDTARWHFFIGSPGNGKSAALGKLCRCLMNNKGCKIFDGAVEITELERDKIPYMLHVYENSKKFSTAWIVQDASVVPNPFLPDIDPAKELLKVMKNAWEKGVSLVICANRGILEKAHRDNHTDKQVNSQEWFKILTRIVGAKTSLQQTLGGEREFDKKKTIFEKVRIGYSHLDNYSLLLGESHVFEQLFKNATSQRHWEICSSCPVQNMCPFNANKDWLLDSDARSNVLQLLTRAEVMSGQVIVFREALAIISFILAGCQADYGPKHPCEWVQDKANSNDVFSLAVRRIYMCLFASHSPHGLEIARALRERQENSLRDLFGSINGNDLKSCIAMRYVVQKKDSPSTDVGVTRLLGPRGIIASLDPCREVLPVAFYECWDYLNDIASNVKQELFTQIEKNCILVWKNLEEEMESTSDHLASGAYWALRRWSSNFLLHFGALLEGRSAWADELDNFTELLGIVAKSSSQRSPQEKQRLGKLNDQMEKILNSVTGNQGESIVKLSDVVKLSGRWVQDKLNPKIVSSEESGSISLAIQFVGGERAVFAAPMYLWLTRRAEGKLDIRCFPQDLLLGAMDARVRAASKGNYAFEGDGVKLEIRTGKGEVFELERFGGEVVEG